MLRIYPQQVTTVPTEPGARGPGFTVCKATKKAAAEQHPKHTRQTVGRLSLTKAICQQLRIIKTHNVTYYHRKHRRRINTNYKNITIIIIIIIISKTTVDGAGGGLPTRGGLPTQVAVLAAACRRVTACRHLAAQTPSTTGRPTVVR